MQLPIIVLGIQPQGPFSLQQAERYLEACRARQKQYQVLCVEVGPATRELISTDTTFGLAHKRAESALGSVPDALVAVGLQSNKIEIGIKGHTYTTECAVASLIQRERSDEPNFVMSTATGGHRIAMRVIADVIRNWNSGAYFHAGNAGHSTAIARTIVSRALRRA